MDLILHNARIYSMQSEKDIYEAIAVKDGLIKGLGKNQDILKMATTNTQIIDLNHKMVFPGFNDSHMHLLGLGASLSQVDLSHAKSIDDIIETTKHFIKDNNIEAGKWVVGRGWNQDFFADNFMPDAIDLDDISDDHYIFLRRACGHVATCNSRVLEDFDFPMAYTSIDGGSYENGIFKENALELITSKMALPSKEDLKTWIKAGCHYANSLGITSVQSDDLCVYPESHNQTVFSSFYELDADNSLSVRVYEQSLLRNINILKDQIKAGYQQNKGSLFFKLGPLKILGDGSLGGRTAWLNEPYHDAPNESGIHMYSQEDLNDYVLEAHKHDISSAIHCIGDKMLDSAIEAIELAQAKVAKANLRHGIVHCQITRPDQLKKLKDLDIMTYVQPVFLDYDAHIVRDRVGKLAETSYNFKSMMDLDIRMSFGSDAPVDSTDPIQGIHCAVTRKDLNNKPEEAYLPDQAVSVYQAIYNYTVESAYASYEEDIKGKLIKDYLADIVVLEGDIFNQILDSSVFMTIVGGRIVYQK